MDNDSVVVYWAPPLFSDVEASWNLLYPEPEPLRIKIQELHTGFNRGFHACPSIRDFIKNIYVLKSAVNESIDLPTEYTSKVFSTDIIETVPSLQRQIVAMIKERVSSFDGYINLRYNLSWIFFSEEPLLMRFTAPFLPSNSPSPGAMLACGEMDIGQWFRPVNLDYHIPLENTSFNITVDQELAYVKFETNKKIILKRFVFTKPLANYADEMSNSSVRYDQYVPLKRRYEMAKKSKMTKLIIKEIQNNLID